MEVAVVNILLGFLAFLSFVWAFFSPENRVIALIVGFTLFILIFLSEQNQTIKELADDQKRLEEKLKIHQQLIDIRSDIAMLKEQRGKR